MKNIKIQVLNIKIFSERRKGDSMYEKALLDIFENKVTADIGRGNSSILRTKFETSINNTKVIYGKISRYTTLDSPEWINLSNLEVTNYEIPKNLFPNVKEADYFFIPEAHRLAIVTKPNGYTIKNGLKFFYESISQVIETDEDFDVTMEQDHSGIEEILSASMIKTLDIEISYTNNDTNEETAEYIDEQMKKIQANKAKLQVRPDHRGSIITEGNFLKGFLNLARSNGSAIATVTNEANERRKIHTKDYPLEINIPVENEDEIISNIFNKIMNIFRP